MTEKRFQVFVSSTYVDLVEERREVMQALLELDCIPAGMEAFVATDETQWELITEVIDLSDYYVLIVGGRYGSTTSEGISYTEKEFNYAKAQKIPIIVFVHANPDGIPRGLADKDDDPEVAAEKQRRLEDFRKRAMTDRNVKTFSNASELGSVVSRSLVRLMKRNPRTGWVRGDKAMTLEHQKEMADLKAKLAELELSQSESESKLSEDISSLASGSDLTSLHVMLEYGYHHSRKSQTANVSISWDGIFSTIGPALLNEETEAKLQEILSRKLAVLAFDQGLFDIENSSDPFDPDARCYADEWPTVVMQLKALGLIDVGTKRRSTTDKGKYLGLTQRGERHLTVLRAIRKDDSNQSADRTEAQPELEASPAQPSPEPQA